MEYTRTRIDKSSQRYPMEQRSQVPDSLEEQLNKNIFLGKLEDMMHGAVNWGRKNSIWTYNFGLRSEEQTSELQSLMRISYAVFCLKKKKKKTMSQQKNIK